MYKIVFPDGKIFELEYEEMVELASAGIESKSGNECFENMKAKARLILDALPVSDY